MKIGAYQFAINSDIEYNFGIIKAAINQAVEKDVKLLVFPECALTGYPPRDINHSADVDFVKLNVVYDQLQELVDENGICVIVGSIIKEDDKYYNCAIIFRPYEEKGLVLCQDLVQVKMRFSSS